MGVHGLWTLLSPAGRKINIKSIANKRLAIDISLWIHRIMHGIKNSKGEINSKGFLRSIFKRICKLLLIGVRPVFVFDGPAPALKKNTIKKRMEQLNKSQINYKKVAEKLILKKLLELDMIEKNKNNPQYPTKYNEIPIDDEIENLFSSDSVSQKSVPSFENFENSLNDSRISLADANKNNNSQLLEEKSEKVSKKFLSEYFDYLNKKKDAERELEKQTKDEFIKRAENLIEEKNKEIDNGLIQKIMNKPNVSMFTGKLEENKDFIFFRGKSESAKDQLKGSNDNQKKRKSKYQRIIELTDELLNMISFRSDSQINIEEEVNKVLTSYKEYNENQNECYKIQKDDKKVKSLNINELQKEYFEDIFFFSDDEMCEEKEVGQDQNKAIIFNDQIEIEDNEEIEGKTKELNQNCLVEEKNQNFLINHDVYFSDLTEVIKEEINNETEMEFEEEKENKDDQRKLKSNSFQIEQSSIQKKYNEKSFSINTFGLIIEELGNESKSIHLGNGNSIEKAKTLNLNGNSGLGIIYSNKGNLSEFIFSDPNDHRKGSPKKENSNPEIVNQSNGNTKNDFEINESTLAFRANLDESNFLEFNQEDEYNFYQFQNPDISWSISSMDQFMISNILEEIKQLLDSFGIPWLESFGEAEATCAHLESIGFVDGIINEDSDCFLFGAKNVYRRVFELQETIDLYSMSIIKQQLGLDRNKLIMLAMFLGSDYTQGVKGIGIVNSMEIVSVFEDFEGLKRFSEWAQSADIFLESARKYYEGISLKEIEYKNSHKNYKNSWEVPENFPSEEVYNAYLKPLVNEKFTNFKWDSPKYENLKEICIKKIGFLENEADFQISHIKKILDANNLSQHKITEFISSNTIANIRSNRLKEAVNKMSGSMMKKRKPDQNEIGEIYSYRISKKTKF